EIVPILSGGMSFNRFIRPYMVAASVIFAFNFAFSVYIIPRTHKLKVRFERIYVKPVENNTKSSTHMQIDEDSYVYIDNFDNNRKIGHNFVLEKFTEGEMTEKLMADRITWDSIKNNWRIENYTIRIIDSLKE